MTATGRAAPAVLRDPLSWLLLPLGAAAIILRILWLDTVPGVNGDEAWYGIWALRCVREGVCVLHTPSGNLINPFYMVLIAAAQAVGPPSIAVLRLPAVISGIVFPLLGYALLRAPLGRYAALAFMVLAAALPID